jgi:hypothetical protein
VWGCLNAYIQAIEANDRMLLSLQEAVERVRRNLTTFDTFQKKTAMTAFDVRITYVDKNTIEVSGLIPLERLDISAPHDEQGATCFALRR